MINHQHPGAPQRTPRTLGEAFGHGVAHHITESRPRGRIGWYVWAVCAVLLSVGLVVLP